jgi:hypothetical protein
MLSGSFSTTIESGGLTDMQRGRPSELEDNSPVSFFFFLGVLLSVTATRLLRATSYHALFFSQINLE